MNQFIILFPNKQEFVFLIIQCTQINLNIGKLN